MRPPNDPPAPRRLRGAALTTAALATLRTWPRQQNLTGETLAGALGVSRKALANRPEVVAAIAATKARLHDQTAATRNPDPVAGSYEAQLADLQHQLVMQAATIEELRERLARVEHNAVLLGVDTKMLFRPIAAPNT